MVAVPACMRACGCGASLLCAWADTHTHALRAQAPTTGGGVSAFLPQAQGRRIFCFLCSTNFSLSNSRANTLESFSLRLHCLCTVLTTACPPAGGCLNQPDHYGAKASPRARWQRVLTSWQHVVHVLGLSPESGAAGVDCGRMRQYHGGGKHMALPQARDQGHDAWSICARGA